MNAALRIALFAAAGWIAGEITARTLLAPTDSSPQRPGVVAPLQLPPPSPAAEWRSFLHGLQLPHSDISATELAASPEKLRLPEAAVALCERITAAAAHEFPDLLQAVAAIRDPSVRREAAAALFAAWAEHDVAAALAAVSRHPALAGAALGGVLDTWAERDPRGLMDWLRTRKLDGWARMQAESWAIGALIEHDPAGTMALVQELKPNSLALVNAWRNWCSKSPEAAEAWYASAPQKSRNELYEARLTGLAEKDPAFAWQQAILPPPETEMQSRALASILRAWNQKDNAAATKALAALPAPLWQRELTVTAARQFYGGTESAGNIGAHIPAELQSTFWSHAADAVLEVEGDPALAVRHFEHLPPDDDERISLAERITKAWLKADQPETASAWVESLPRDTARDFAAAELAEWIHSSDPEAAKAWAADIQSDNIREGVLRKLSP